tara:strand:- start:876 stop:1508 length:633 start_codon:yes stop_codon:yes gene_type:complete
VKKINFNKAQYTNSSVSCKTYPQDLGHEVAIVGRSNVGKSSLINKLTGYKRLAKVSKTPGRTQCINFFDIENENIVDYPLRLVDLPGYGYAAVHASVQEKWDSMMAEYLTKRKSLKGLLLIIDIRHLLKKLDLELLTFAKQINVPIHLILNKSDKLSKNKIHQSESKLRKELKAQIGDLQQNNISVQVFSASNGSGVLELEDLLCSWLLP